MIVSEIVRILKHALGYSSKRIETLGLPIAIETLLCALSLRHWSFGPMFGSPNFHPDPLDKK